MNWFHRGSRRLRPLAACGYFHRTPPNIYTPKAPQASAVLFLTITLLDTLAMDQQCHSCSDDYKDFGDKLKLCAGCRKVYYCSTACQNSDWVFHIFDCKPRRINTAYYLARAVYRDLLPEHPQTCEDYGFNRAVTPEEKSYLMGLYAGMSMTSSI